VSHTIETRGLTKAFGRTLALDGLDLTVERGEVHGFLGPNGSGKSTTIRILLGLLRKDGGKARLLGADPWRDAVARHRRLAYVPGDVRLWPNLTGGEAIDLLTALRGPIDRRRCDSLIERFALDPTKRCDTYSKGNRQKVAIIAGLSSDVELLLLDEPTNGLDPLMEAVFQGVIQEYRATGGTILLSSHILAEAEALCDTVSIIRDGRIVESGTLAQLRHLTRTTVTVTTDRPLEGLDRLPGVHDVARSQDGLTASLEVASEDLAGLVTFVGAHGVRSLTAAPPTLEELFLRHYGDELAALTRTAAP